MLSLTCTTYIAPLDNALGYTWHLYQCLFCVSIYKKHSVYYYLYPLSTLYDGPLLSEDI